MRVRTVAVSTLFALGLPACYEEAGKYRITIPDITVARERYTDRDLVILLRHGRKQDGALVDFMPWDMYAHLTERDLAHVIAFVRSTPAVARTLPDSEYSWATRWQMLRGAYPLQNDLADYDTKPLEGVAERGRYLASATGLMSMVARSRFSAYTPDELVALKTYLDQRDP